MTMLSPLADKVAIVTGGSRGIGFAIARALLRLGASVAITATTDEGAIRAAGELEADGMDGRVMPLRMDVRRYDEVDRAMSEVVSRFGGLDMLVNNAGVGVFRSVAETTVDDWNMMIETNLTGVFHCSHAALPLIEQRGGGWIINISSLSSRNPFANGAAYSATKAAVNAFSEALMQEVRYHGVRVAYVLPGSVNTGFGGLPGTRTDGILEPDDVAQVVADLVVHPSRSLPSRVEIRPAQPPRKV